MPMEIDAIIGEERNTDDGGHISYSTKRPDDLFFMDPDHKEVRISEEPEVQDYWEAGLTTELLSALKTGRADHSQIVCYHRNYRGHIKANCLDRRYSNKQPWDRRWKTGRHPQEKATIREGGGEDNPHETTHLQEDGKTTDKRRNHGISSKWKGPPLQTSKT